MRPTAPAAATLATTPPIAAPGWPGSEGRIVGVRERSQERAGRLGVVRRRAGVRHMRHGPLERDLIPEVE